MSSFRSDWRDAKAWKDENLPMTNGSNEACKIFDAALTQYVGWYSDPVAFGGMDVCCRKLSEEDNFVMGQVLATSLSVMGGSVSAAKKPPLCDNLSRLSSLGEHAEGITSRETTHINAVLKMGEGDMLSASYLYEDILLRHPTDMFALKSLWNCCYFMGQPLRIRNAYGRSIPSWKESTPLYGYLFGNYAYGLCETGNRAEAEKNALKGLSINRADAWSIHAMAHVYEETSRWKQGRQFYRDNESIFGAKGMFCQHNYWHMGLFNIELGDSEAALGVYDSHLSQACGNTVDSASFLFRLEMDGIDVGERWEDIFEVVRPTVDDERTWGFSDLHLMLGLVGAKKPVYQEKFISNLKEYIEESSLGDVVTNRPITRDVVLPVVEALSAYGDGRYGDAAEGMLKQRYNIIRTGGSDAQRDVFNILLISAAMKSPGHQQVARQLLYERELVKPNSTLTDRLTARCMSTHSV